MQQSIVAGIYEQQVDRDSAHEMLQQKYRNVSSRHRPLNLPNNKPKNRKHSLSSKPRNRNVWPVNSRKKWNVPPSSVKNSPRTLSALLQKCSSQPWKQHWAENCPWLIRFPLRPQIILSFLRSKASFLWDIFISHNFFMVLI